MYLLVFKGNESILEVINIVLIYNHNFMADNMSQGETGASEEHHDESKQSGASTMQADIKGLVGPLEAILDEYMVSKAPFALPLGIKEFIVTVSPYLVIISVIFALPLLLGALGLGAIMTPLGMMAGGWGFGWGFNHIVSLVVTIATILIQAFAVPGLFKRTSASWRLLFYASIVSLIGSVLSVYGIVGGIIGAIISWYILFQLKDMYKN